MAKSKSKVRRKASKAPAQPAPTRRDMLKLARNGALGAAALGGVGWFSVSAVRATAAEADLTRIGKGKPVIVQVHDPQCPMCTQLQRETRKALKCFEECDVVYLVANVKGPEGQAFAGIHGVSHVTLVLFDADGTRQQILNGVRSRDELKPIFQRLAGTA